MILSRERILDLIKESALLENFSPDCLEGAGYDLRIGKVYRLKGGGRLLAEGKENPEVEEVHGGEFSLAAGEYVLIESLEKVNMPVNLVARILPRSTVFRNGCALITALVDPGFKGTLTMGLKNLSGFEFRFQHGARVAQIVFEEVSGETKPYEGHYQGGRIV